MNKKQIKTQNPKLKETLVFIQNEDLIQMKNDNAEDHLVELREEIKDMAPLKVLISLKDLILIATKSKNLQDLQVFLTLNFITYFHFLTQTNSKFKMNSMYLTLLQISLLLK